VQNLYSITIVVHCLIDRNCLAQLSEGKKSGSQTVGKAQTMELKRFAGGNENLAENSKADHLLLVGTAGQMVHKRIKIDVKSMKSK